jgi:hypothetical protein
MTETDIPLLEAVIRSHTTMQGMDITNVMHDGKDQFYYTIKHVTDRLPKEPLGNWNVFGSFDDDDNLLAFQCSCRFSASCFYIGLSMSNSYLRPLPKTYGADWPDAIIDLTNFAIDLYALEGRNHAFIMHAKVNNPDWKPLWKAPGLAFLEWERKIFMDIDYGVPIPEDGTWFLTIYETVPLSSQTLVMYTVPSSKFDNNVIPVQADPNLEEWIANHPEMENFNA